MANSTSPAYPRWLLVGALILVGAGAAALWRAPRPAAKPLATPDDSFVRRQRTLQDGRRCLVTIYAPGIASHPVEQVQRIEMQVDGKALYVPAAAFQDLAHVSGDRVQIADFAGDVFLLLGGEKEGKPWSVKLTGHDGRITQRQLSLLGDRPKVTRFAAPIHPTVVALRPEDLAAHSSPISPTPPPISSTP